MHILILVQLIVDNNLERQPPECRIRDLAIVRIILARDLNCYISGRRHLIYILLRGSTRQGHLIPIISIHQSCFRLNLLGRQQKSRQQYSPCQYQTYYFSHNVLLFIIIAITILQLVLFANLSLYFLLLLYCILGSYLNTISGHRESLKVLIKWGFLEII